MASARFVQKKRTSNFRDDETKLLIQLWGSPQVQNKLYLTHRKAPVMRLLAASMQQNGFYRTPDEIKTRIRNLKCLYHRIKRTLQSGSGVGTVDTDWIHFKAMDDILTKQSQRHRENPYKDNIFDGPRCEDIKQEVEDIDINDDMESYTTNSLGGSDYDEDAPAAGASASQPPPLIPAPSNESAKKDKEIQTAKNKAGPVVGPVAAGGAAAAAAPPAVKFQGAKPLPNLLPNISIPIQNHQVSTSAAGAAKPGGMHSLPFPLLILNGIQPPPHHQPPQQHHQQQQQQLSQVDRGRAAGVGGAGGGAVGVPTNIALNGANVKHGKNFTAIGNTDLINYMKDLVEIQREHLSVEKQKLELKRQRLEMERQRFDYEKSIGSQMLAFVPFVNDILDRAKSTFTSEQLILGSFGRHNKRGPETDDNPREAKILRSFLQTNIKRSPSDIEDELSDNGDSGIQNDEAN